MTHQSERCDCSRILVTSREVLSGQCDKCREEEFDEAFISAQEDEEKDEPSTESGEYEDAKYGL